MHDDAASAFLFDLSTTIYSLPLSELRDHLQDVPEVLRTVILVLDFATEIEMDGVLGFLENSTGRFLPETIVAMRTIGAHETAATLTRIDGILQRFGSSPQALNAELNGLEPGQITTFREAHPQVRKRMITEIDAEDLGSQVPMVRDLLHDYAASHLPELRAAVSKCRRE